MKKILIPLLIISGFAALYEQSKEHPNVYVMVAAIVIFMLGMMKLTSMTPGKNDEKPSDDV